MFMPIFTFVYILSIVVAVKLMTYLLSPSSLRHVAVCFYWLIFPSYDLNIFTFFIFDNNLLDARFIKFTLLTTVFFLSFDLLNILTFDS